MFLRGFSVFNRGTGERTHLTAPLEWCKISGNTCPILNRKEVLEEEHE